MRQLHAVQAGTRSRAAGDACDSGVLPGGVEVQMWQQVIHAVNLLINSDIFHILTIVLLYKFKKKKRKGN